MAGLDQFLPERNVRLYVTAGPDGEKSDVHRTIVDQKHREDNPLVLRTNPEIPPDEIERFVDNVDHIRPARIELEEVADLHRRPKCCVQSGPRCAGSHINRIRADPQPSRHPEGERLTPDCVRHARPPLVALSAFS